MGIQKSNWEALKGPLVLLMIVLVGLGGIVGIIYLTNDFRIGPNIGSTCQKTVYLAPDGTQCNTFNPSVYGSTNSLEDCTNLQTYYEVQNIATTTIAGKVANAAGQCK